MFRSMCHVSIIITMVSFSAQAQVELLKSPTTARLRGLSVVNESTAWASGTAGTYLRTTDGTTWVAKQVPGAEELDFRDVHAFDQQTAVLLAIGPGEKSRLYRTTDGGENWILAYQETDPAAFLDAIAFWDAKHGIAMGDPVNGKFFILTTDDGGKTWNKLAGENMPPVLKNEGAFAASGTCLITFEKSTALFGTGGAEFARVFKTVDRGKSWTAYPTPIRAGAPPMGIFSVAMIDENRGVVVGGAYDQADLQGRIAAYTSDGWKTSKCVEKEEPAGFRSAVVAVNNIPMDNFVVSVGLSGVDLSYDLGLSWKPLSKEGFHAVGFANPSIGWAVGDNGKLGKIGIPTKPSAVPK